MSRPKHKIRNRFAMGLTMVELVVTLSISVIPISSVGILIVNGQRSWQNSYQSANRPVLADSQHAFSLFERTGRKSDGSSSVVLPTGSSEGQTDSVLTINADFMQTGKAVEFRYWSAEKPYGSVPTEYARFYFDSESKELKLDRGEYPYKIIGRTIYPGIGTMILSKNVEDVKFSRTIINNAPQNCIRMALTLTDPTDGKVFELIAVTLMRN